MHKVTVTKKQIDNNVDKFEKNHLYSLSHLSTGSSTTNAIQKQWSLSNTKHKHSKNKNMRVRYKSCSSTQFIFFPALPSFHNFVGILHGSGGLHFLTAAANSPKSWCFLHLHLQTFRNCHLKWMGEVKVENKIDPCPTT